jgi:hypothetical protein
MNFGKWRLFRAEGCVMPGLGALVLHREIHDRADLDLASVWKT